MIRRWPVFVVVSMLCAACSSSELADPPGAPSRPVTSTTSTVPATTTTTSTTAPAPPEFAATVAEVDPARVPYSWHEGCPVPLAELRLVTLSHWGFDGTVKTGELVVAAKQSDNVVGVMRKLFELKFPIERMKLIDEYKGDDDLSVAANNSSAFNCRSVTGRPGVWSQHSYGWAIDINPFQNPFISNGKLTPPGAERFRDRSLSERGMIHGNDAVVKAFRSIGWEWGGTWSNPKDYQHFSLTGR